MAEEKGLLCGHVGLRQHLLKSGPKERQEKYVCQPLAATRVFDKL